MKPEIKQLWVKALRSGEYQQVTGSLKTATGYCCLGVLADCYVQAIPDAQWRRYPGMDWYIFEHPSQFESSSCLPNDDDVFVNWAGHMTDDTQRYLTDMNDDLQCSFNEIANWVEENL